MVVYRGGVAWDWTQLEGFQHFCFVRCYSGFEQILALCILQGLIGRCDCPEALRVRPYRRVAFT